MRSTGAAGHADSVFHVNLRRPVNAGVMHQDSFLMSVVESNRKQLEAIGDYVTRANVNWFAVFPDKLAEFD